MCRSEFLSGTALAILLPLGSLVILGGLIFASFWKPRELGDPQLIWRRSRCYCSTTSMLWGIFWACSHEEVAIAWPCGKQNSYTVQQQAAEAAGNWFSASSRGVAMVQRQWWQTSVVKWGAVVLGGGQRVVVLQAGAAAVCECIFESFVGAILKRKKYHRAGTTCRNGKTSTHFPC